jgi:hypothetical protein
MVGEMVGEIAVGLRQHNHSWFQVPSGPMTKSVFVPRPLTCFEMGLLSDERKGWPF